jgi:hypothetical protein
MRGREVLPFLFLPFLKEIQNSDALDHHFKVNVVVPPCPRLPNVQTDPRKAKKPQTKNFSSTMLEE